jgi:hypothetical protein
VALHAEAHEWPAVLDYLAPVVEVMEKAKVYRFANVPGRRAETGAMITTVFPGLNDDAAAYFNCGKAKLPHEVCWFETELRPGATLGLLIVDGGDRINVHEFNRIRTAHGVEIQFCCYGNDVLRTMLISPEELATFPPLHGSATDAAKSLPTTLAIHAVDPLGHYARYAGWQRNISGDISEAELWMTMAAETRMSTFMLMVLRSRNKRIETVQAKTFANRKRLAKGLRPVPDHIVVTMMEDWAPGRLDETTEEETRRRIGI